MSEFVTLDKKDKMIATYLMGEVPERSDYIAVPAQSFLGPTRGSDKFTFQILDKSTVVSPSKLSVFFRLIRWQWLSLTLMPVLVTYTYLLQTGFYFNFLNFIFLIICVFFSHSAVFILNDLYDHLNFSEYTRAKGGTQVIQNGWMSPRKVKLWGYLALGLSVCSGIYLAFLLSFKLLYLGPLGLLAGFLYSYLSRYRRFIGLDLIMVTFFLGPFLVYSLASGGHSYFNTGLLLTGFYFGFLAYMCTGYRHIENLILKQEDKGSSIFQVIGFDKSKNFLIFCILLLPFFYIISCLYLGIRFNSIFESVFILPIICYLVFLKSGVNLKSSLGSSIVRLRQLLILFHFVSGLTLIVYFLLRIL